MIKKEIAEIKKQLDLTKGALTRVCGCLVDEEKNLTLTMEEAFGSLPEEEQFKYLELFRKALSGSLGKNLFSVSFSTDAEREGTPHETLMKLKTSALKDEEALTDMYEALAATLEIEDKYLILFLHGIYDIPGKGTDHTTMVDASEDVYEYLIGVVCPVKLAKPGLVVKEKIENRIRDQVVEMPVTGFLFPAFTDRTTDIHELLFYSKSADLPQKALVTDWLEANLPAPETVQKEQFQTLIEDTFGTDCSLNTVKQIQETLIEKLEDGLETEELSASDMRAFLQQVGAENVEQIRDDLIPMTVAGITETKDLKIKSDTATVSVKQEYADDVRVELVDGRKCLILPLEGEVTANGIHVY